MVYLSIGTTMGRDIAMVLRVTSIKHYSIHELASIIVAAYDMNQIIVFSERLLANISSA